MPRPSHRRLFRSRRADPLRSRRCIRPSVELVCTPGSRALVRCGRAAGIADLRAAEPESRGVGHGRRARVRSRGDAPGGFRPRCGRRAAGSLDRRRADREAACPFSCVSARAHARGAARANGAPFRGRGGGGIRHAFPHASSASRRSGQELRPCCPALGACFGASRPVAN